jgi:hypothetical protein
VRPDIVDEETMKKLRDTDPYKRAISVLGEVEMSDTVIWYAYRYSRHFIRFLDYAEDILHEILCELLKYNLWELCNRDISRISRNCVAKFIAKTVMTLSGYTNFRSWLNRKNILKYRNDLNVEPETELEQSVAEIERIWNSNRIPNEPAKIIADKYPLVSTYAESGLSMVNFCKVNNITKYRLCKMIDSAREDYISLVITFSYLESGNAV